MSNSSKYRLGELVTLKRGYDLPHASRTPGKFPVVSSSGITGSHKESMVKGPGVVTGRYGTLGQVFYIPGPYWPLNTSLYVQDFKGNDPRFVAYYLRIMLSANFNSAGAVPGVNRNILHKLAVPAPPVEQESQRKIAAILTTYDDLIELNQRRIALLENTAEEIYREWFVRMRFPGHETSNFIKGVPVGWPFELGSVFFSHVKGKPYSSHEISDDDGVCFFITLKSFHRRGGYRKEALKYFSGSYKDVQCVEAGDVVMAVTDMTQDRAVVGEVARIPKLTGKKAIISLDVIRLIPKHMSPTFLYAYMRHSGFANYIKAFANGANVLHLKPDLVGKQRLLFPPEYLRDKFSDLVEPIYEEVNILEEANAVLIKARDLLLLRLISGKLSVGNLEIQFPPSMQKDVSAQESELKENNG